MVGAGETDGLLVGDSVTGSPTQNWVGDPVGSGTGLLTGEFGLVGSLGVDGGFPTGAFGEVGVGSEGDVGFEPPPSPLSPV